MTPRGKVAQRTRINFTSECRIIVFKSSLQEQKGLDKTCLYAIILGRCRLKFVQMMAAMGRMGQHMGIKVLFWNISQKKKLEKYFLKSSKSMASHI